MARIDDRDTCAVHVGWELQLDGQRTASAGEAKPQISASGKPRAQTLRKPSTTLLASRVHQTTT
jgi:hypothetical protein